MSVDGEICARERVECSRISDSVLPEIFGVSLHPFSRVLKTSVQGSLMDPVFGAIIL